MENREDRNIQIRTAESINDKKELEDMLYKAKGNTLKREYKQKLEYTGNGDYYTDAEYDDLLSQ